MGLDITGVGSIFDFGSKVIDKIWPDPATRDKAKLELLKAQQEGAFREFDQLIAASKMQADTNTAEASNANVFVSGWRPAIGWVCAASLFCQFIGAPMLAWVSLSADLPAPPAPPDWAQLTPILMGMLGLGWMRTYEKKNGVAK